MSTLIIQPRYWDFRCDGCKQKHSTQSHNQRYCTEPKCQAAKRAAVARRKKARRGR